MLSIVDAYASSPQSQGLENASLVNFWAFSYGTYVAQTFASIHPDRVGRFVMDGVVDPDDYRSGDLLKNLQFTDEAFSTYFVYCHLAGPTVCPYATGTSAYDIFSRFEQTVRRLDVTEAEKQGWANATVISLLLEGLKQFAHNVAYEPINAFPALAPVLLFMETASQNATEATVQQFKKLTGEKITIALGSIEWTRAVACSDMGNVLFNQTLEDLSNVTKIMEQQSYVGGEFWASLRVACLGWGIGREGTYIGTFGGASKNQMLFVSNTLDPATPYYNGVKGTQLFPGSELLLIDGAGHTTLGPLNNCGNAKINAFFQNGTLPGDDKFCELEAGPFNITISDGIQNRNDWQDLKIGMRSLKQGKSRSIV